MTVSAASDVYFDPYDVGLIADPYPMFGRLRDKAPLYYNEQHDCYALSRFADVDDALVDYQTFSSARGAILEIIEANIDIPAGTVIFEDPPIHDIRRKLLSRFPEWDVDLSECKLSPTSTVRGWETTPAQLH